MSAPINLGKQSLSQDFLLSYDEFLDDESDSGHRCRHQLFYTIHAFLIILLLLLLRHMVSPLVFELMSNHSFMQACWIYEMHRGEACLPLRIAFPDDEPKQIQRQAYVQARLTACKDETERILNNTIPARSQTSTK